MQKENEIQSVTLSVIGDGNKRKRYEELTFLDDFMFGKIMSDKENCREFLRILLKIDPETEIADPVTQNSLRNSPESKSIIVDVRTHDEFNDYDIEAQKQNHPNLPKRTRYYQAMMDVDFLEAGHDYLELRNNFIIFICLHDLFGAGRPVYTFQNRCNEDNSILLSDETKKIFLVASKCDKIKSNREIRDFMEYVKTGNAESTYTQRIDEIVRKAHENPIWKREYMDAMIEDIRVEKARYEGARNNALQNARNFLNMGLSIEMIAKGTGLSIEEIKSLQKGM